MTEISVKAVTILGHPKVFTTDIDILWKTNIFCQGIRNFTFFENFVCVLNEWSRPKSIHFYN